MTPIQELIKEIDDAVVEAIEKRNEIQKRLDKHKKMFSWYKNQYIMHHINDKIEIAKISAIIQTLEQTKKLAESKLQAEREAIQKAFYEGYINGVSYFIDPELSKYKDSEDYYNQTFKTK